MLDTVETLGSLLMQAKRSDMENCERMYRHVWRSQPFPAADLERERFEELEYDLRVEAAAKSMRAKFGDQALEQIMERYHDEIGEVAAGLPPAITGETLVVELANYKGEGEGLAVFDQVKHLPVFMSRQHSAEFFNC